MSSYNRLHDQIKSSGWHLVHTQDNPEGGEKVHVFRKYGLDGHVIHVRGENWHHLHDGETVGKGTGYKSYYDHSKSSQHAEELPSVKKRLQGTHKAIRTHTYLEHLKAGGKPNEGGVAY